MAAQSAVRMRENSLRRKFDRYVHSNPLNADLQRKAYSAVAAKLARIVYGLIKHGTVSAGARCRWNADVKSQLKADARCPSQPATALVSEQTITNAGR